MKQIILTRHAETKENQAGVFQSNNQTEFTNEGKISLEKLKKEVEKYNFQLALVSDLPRCLTTAHIILGQRATIIRAEPLLREKSNGQLAGQAFNQENWDNLPGNFETKKPLGGESLIEVRDRAEKLATLLKKLPEERILVVSHGGFLKVFFGLLLGKHLRESIFDLRVDHCSLTTLEINQAGQFEFKAFNVTNYLSDIL